MILSETRIRNMKRGELYIVHCCFGEWLIMVVNLPFQTLTNSSTASRLNSVHGLKTQGSISSTKRQK